MEFYKPRKVKFKAWNAEARLLMRLTSVDCLKGELMKAGHTLLQFTGRLDSQEEELYELDIVLMDSEKYVLIWDDELTGGWYFVRMKDQLQRLPATAQVAGKCIRLCNYFESTEN